MKNPRLALCLLILASLCLVPPAGASADQALPAQGMVTLLDLGAASCIPCKMMAPILEELKAEYAGRAEVRFIDVSHNRAAIERYKLRGIPTQIFFDRQGREVHRHLGFMDKQAIIAVLTGLGVK